MRTQISRVTSNKEGFIVLNNMENGDETREAVEEVRKDNSPGYQREECGVRDRGKACNSLWHEETAEKTRKFWSN